MEGWLRHHLEGGLPVTQLGRLPLQPGAQAGFGSRGRVVCKCWNVGECEIVTTLNDWTATRPTTAALQSRLRCGTQCGSRPPELKRIVAETRGTVSA